MINIHSSDFLYRLRSVIPVVRYPLHREERYRPFFVVGSGRSGTTLFRRILCANKNIHIPPENNALSRIIQVYGLHNTLGWRNLLYLVLANFQYHPDFEYFELSLKDLHSIGLDLRQLPKTERSLARILNEIYLTHAQLKNVECTVWGDKTPRNVFAMENIRRVFPEAKFINLIRDGGDVVHSFLKAGIHKNAEKAANMWIDSLLAASKFNKKHPDACLNLRYEDLVTNSEELVRKACIFLDIKFVEGMLHSEGITQKMGDVQVLGHHKNLNNPISEASVGKGRKMLTPEQRIIIGPIINPMLEKLGYQRIDV